MTQEKPRRENLSKRALYLSLHRKIKYTFTTEFPDLSHTENSRFPCHTSASKTVPMIYCTNSSCFLCLHRNPYIVRNSVRTSKIMLFLLLKIVPTLFCTTASKSMLILYCMTVSICVQQFSLGIHANSQLRNLLFLFKNSLALFFSLVICLHHQPAFKE